MKTNTNEHAQHIGSPRRGVILNLAVSLDGFIEGPNGEFDW
jgi:hypothetical protein